MLTRLYVDNFRCLVNFEHQFGSKQLLLGPNGSGKTTILDVLELLRDFCALGIAPELRMTGASRTRWLDHPVQTFEMDVTGNGGLYTFRLKVESWGSPERLRVQSEE